MANAAFFFSLALLSSLYYTRWFISIPHTYDPLVSARSSVRWSIPLPPFFPFFILYIVGIEWGIGGSWGLIRCNVSLIMTALREAAVHPSVL